MIIDKNEMQSASFLEQAEPSANTFAPGPNQIAVIDTFNSRIHWLRRKDFNNKFELCCNYYLISKNLVLTPAVKVATFENLDEAWAELMKISEQPNMRCRKMLEPPAHRTIYPVDIQLLMEPLVGHIQSLEKELSEVKPWLDAYKRTGWEPCDYHHLTHYKEENERLKMENHKLMSYVESYAKKVEKLQKGENHEKTES